MVSIPVAHSASCAQAVEHRRDAIEERIARLDLLRLDVAPRDRYAQRGARLAVGACRRGEPRDAISALAMIALRRVERDGAERPSKLLAQVAILVTNSCHGGPQDFDRVDRKVENEEA